MHILLGLLSTLSLIAILIIRANHAANAVEDLSYKTKGAGRRLRIKLFGHKVPEHPLSEIVDPRDGILALMVAVMKDDGDLTEQQIAQLEYWAANRLNLSAPEEHVALARWQVRDFVESGAVLYRLHKRLAELCDGEQRADAIELIEQAAKSKGGPITKLQAHTIQQLKYHFGDVRQLTINE